MKDSGHRITGSRMSFKELMKKTIIALFICVIATTSCLATTLTTDIFTTSSSWTAPTGVTIADVYAWGAGGGAGSYGAGRNPLPGAGGGGGSFAAKYLISVTPGNTYTVMVGVGGNGATYGSAFPGIAGTDSWFSDILTVFASGGIGGGNDGANGGFGGLAVNNIGDVVFNGGNGAVRGSGGGGAGTLFPGSNGTSGSSQSGGSGGASDGGDGGTTTLAQGGDGSTIGGGGGGSYARYLIGGNGSRGEVRVIYELP